MKTIALKRFIRVVAFTASSVAEDSTADLTTVLFPGSGNTLDEIQNLVNTWMILHLSNDLNWFYEDIRKYGHGIFVEGIDFQSSQSNRLNQLRRINVLVFDLDSIAVNPSCHNWIKQQLVPFLPRTGSFQICQTSQNSKPAWSVLPLLTQLHLRVSLPVPKILSTEDMFVENLKRLVSSANAIWDAFLDEFNQTGKP